MKREARILLRKACDSLQVAVERFNSPHDAGRCTTVLIMLDHAFEMFLKAAILHRGGSLRDADDEYTIGFAKSVRKAISDGQVKFLSDEQALTLQVTNGLRDAAQHHILDLCEEQLYIQAQASVTLFDDLLSTVFGKCLHECLPKRVLPISTVALKDIVVLFERQVAEIQKLLVPGRRRSVEADAMLKPLAIMDNAIHGDTLPPNSRQIAKLRNKLKDGAPWGELFPGVASVRYEASGEGVALALRLTKKEGVPTYLVPEGSPGTAVIAVKRVNELDFYCFGRDQVAERADLTRSMASALIWHAKLKGNLDYHKQIRIGRSVFDRYSTKAVDRLRELSSSVDLESVWTSYKGRTRKGSATASV